MRGYFGVGVENCKYEMNLGTLWRSAHIFGASFIFVIGQRYRRQSSDTTKAWRSIPLYQYLTFEDFYSSMPNDTILTGVEIMDRATPITKFTHNPRAVYLLGAEDGGLSKRAAEKCHRLVQIPGNICLNVAVAGSIIMYDRIAKEVS